MRTNARPRGGVRPHARPCGGARPRVAEPGAGGRSTRRAACVTTPRAAAAAASVVTLTAAVLLFAGCGGPVTVQYNPYTAPGAYTPNDEFYDLQWHYELIDVPGAWAIMRDTDLPREPQPVRVAVIDTGIREHEDLDPARIVDGWDFFDDNSDATDDGPLEATAFHGTHVTGTLIATTGNSAWGAGIAAGDGFAGGVVVPIRALGAPTGCFSSGCVVGDSADIAQAILYAAGSTNASGELPSGRADVINLSLGGGGADPALYEAIETAVAGGATVIAAAGNTPNGTENSANGVLVPASFDNTIAVAAVGPDRRRAPYSNIGPELDFAASGGEFADDANGDGLVDGAIWSTSSCPDGENLVDCISAQQGTSMATPHVAGVVALLYSYAPEITQDVVYDILLASADDAGDPGHDERYGHGIVNARAALEYLIRATDGYAVAPVGTTAGAGGGGDAVGSTAPAAATAAPAATTAGPRGRPLPRREGAFLPAATAAAGRDYDATSVLFSLRQERLAPIELDQAKARIASEVSGVTAVTGNDPRRLRGALAAGGDPDIVIQELAEHPDVRFAQPNYLYTVPALYPWR